MRKRQFVTETEKKPDSTKEQTQETPTNWQYFSDGRLWEVDHWAHNQTNKRHIGDV